MNLNKITKQEIYNELLDSLEETKRLKKGVTILRTEKATIQANFYDLKRNLDIKENEINLMKLDRIADLKSFIDHLKTAISGHTHRQKETLSNHLIDVLKSKINNLIKELRFNNELPF